MRRQREIERTWRRVDVRGAEQFLLDVALDGPRQSGTIIVAHEDRPLRVEYDIICSPAWETRFVSVVVGSGPTARRLALTANEGHRWSADGQEVPAIAGCVDVDLSLTPSTNMLPVRRLGLLDLPVGELRDVTAAWVRLPELSVEPLAQRYTCLGERRLRYESGGGAFSTELQLDEEGLVVSYPPFWERFVAPPPDEPAQG